MQYIYSSSKHRRSGTTMQKQKPPSALARHKAAREVLPGFPWEGKLQTREEVMDYLSGDEIQCLICGKHYKCLAPHIKRIHNIDAADYKSRYGIAQKSAIDCSSTSSNRREAAKENDVAIASLMKSHDVKRKQKAEKAELPEYVKKENAERFRKAARSQKRSVDFSWHFEALSTVWRYTKLRPPEGFVSWSQFKKRWLADPELRRQMLEARSKFSSSYRIKGKGQ